MVVTLTAPTVKQVLMICFPLLATTKKQATFNNRINVAFQRIWI